MNNSYSEPESVQFEQNPSGPQVPAEPVSESLSKNKLRKLRNYKKHLASRQYRRAKEREAKKSKASTQPNTRRHKDEQTLALQKLKEAQVHAPKIVVDCQFSECMTHKEQRRLAQQLRRAYSSNKAAPEPLHLYFSSFQLDSEFHKVCVRLNDGFNSYAVDRSEKSVLELFPDHNEQLVYLTPDSPNTLEAFDPHKIYVIGGLVDETTQKNISYSFTTEKSVISAKLPIEKYFSRGDQGTFKTVLTVNQVFDIILTWYQTRDWIRALEAGLPKRAGFLARKTEHSE